MSSYVVLTAVGPDRPGLVDDISAFLAERTINIEDSRMAVLGGEFAIIMLVSCKEGLAGRLKKELDEIEKSTGLIIHLKETIAPAQREVEPAVPHRLHVTSMDHPGIVHEITHLLHNHKVNIESLDTHVSHAPISGAPIFNMHCTINIPAAEKISIIRKDLQALEEMLNIDVELIALETY